MDLNDLAHVRRIWQRLAAAEADQPVAPAEDANDLADRLEVALGAEGIDEGHWWDLIEQIVLATPRTASRRFANQLFGGRNWPAVLADLLASALNVSMYTTKVAGVQVALEREVLNRMCRWAGLTGGEGMFAPGGSLSNLTAMLLARNAARPAGREQGLTGPAMRIYTSDQAHYSIRKNAGILGIGRENVVEVASDSAGRLQPDALVLAIAADRAAGLAPLMVVATAGTTLLGAFDPIEPIAEIASTEGLWLHVDAAWGGAVLLSDKHRHLLAGSERADSLTWDAHKMMNAGLVASSLLVARRGLLEGSLSERADYLFHETDRRDDPGTRSLQCGRRNDGMKVWAAWKYYGDEGYARRVEHLFELAGFAADRIEAESGLELLTRPESTNVCFRPIGTSAEALCREMERRKLAVITHGTYAGQSWVRLVCVDPDWSREDVGALLDDVVGVANELAS